MIYFLSTILFLALLSTLFYQLLRSQIVNHRPTTFPKIGQVPHSAAASKTVVVCAGDSITHGNVGSNYVDMLERWLGSNYYFYNAGVNSDLTYTLLNRIDAIIATDPAIVTVLIGTNDVNATVSNIALKRYWRDGKIEKGLKPNLESFKENYTEIVRKLKTQTKARIALASLPVMGEDLANEANPQADLYSEFIKNLAAQENLSYLPVRERMKEFLQDHPKKLKYNYDDTMSLMIKSIFRHKFGGQSWDQISVLHGHDLTHDNLHFNTRGGAIIASTLEKFIKNQI